MARGSSPLGIAFGFLGSGLLESAAMRVVDLDRDMSDVIPTGTTPDSEYLFARMTERTLALAEAGPGRRVLDVASGVGQDALALAADGAWVVAAEPSKRMTDMALLFAAEKPDPRPRWVRSWADGLPFADGAFDAVVCKGAIDHFDRPDEAIGEMARVTADTGRVVLAIANFESLACRMGRLVSHVREEWLGHPSARGRRGYDVPSDHFTRYELSLMREQASKHLILEVVEGISLAWGAPGWSRATARMSPTVARWALEACDGLAARVPTWADVIVLAGRPHRGAAATSR
ncbi:MAG: methyltransferase domain-containing protein [Proteobacteria bacterium]|nr:methyltransferase domain-containing protein [Pseudomonadota bacterium]